MKINLSLAYGAFLALASLTPTLAQSSWQTVDALTPWRGRAIAVDAAGNFISLAIDDSTSSTGPVSTAVSLSIDHGLTWQTVGSIAGYGLKLAAAPDGTLYASGNRSATVSGQACVWQSLDHGTNWTVSNPWAGQPAALISMDLAAGNAGLVYLCGWVSGSYSGGRWIVRKGQPTNNSITWTTVDSFTGTQPNSIAVRAGSSSQPDYIVVCGQASSPGTVRRSADGGATWATIGTGVAGTAKGIAAGADGSIFVLGQSLNSSSWLVAKTTNGGGSWSMVGSLANALPAYGRSIAIDPLGRVLAIGYSSGNPRSWLVRGSADDGATWTTTDSFLPTGYSSAMAEGIAIDSLGDICVVGDVENGTATADLAPIRLLAAP